MGSTEGQRGMEGCSRCFIVERGMNWGAGFGGEGYSEGFQLADPFPWPAHQGTPAAVRS